ncbi:rRNA 2'-O-methyltransferase fibrillarin-like [Rosa chinensis]|uniref:rRNA 2'-O-methyltransferase fibrillarin-like n=1 Tax=Rosa chinensis TaxID=74649 RepID=UPI000D086E04|nr:rRNA 2'-O-methyltransferase fibrillarin-like [Rosa chinensis]
MVCENRSRGRRERSSREGLGASRGGVGESRGGGEGASRSHDGSGSQRTGEGDSRGGGGAPRGSIVGSSLGSGKGSSRGVSSRVERLMVADVPEAEVIKVLDIYRSPLGRLLLGATRIDQQGPSMTEEQIAEMRTAWAIPDNISLRPLRDGETFSHPQLGWACFYEYQLRCGLSFPIPEELQYLL